MNPETQKSALQPETTALATTPGPAPKGVIAPLVELLQRPEDVIVRARDADRLKPALALLVGSLSCAAAYGASAGFFQGGSQVLTSMLKAPLIILGSVALCAPSLFVFSSLAGARLSAARFFTILSAFSALLGLLLVGLLPIAWLFSVSSKSMLFIVWLHLGAWAVALIFAGRFVARAFGEIKGRTGLFLWLLLFLVVSFQVATVLRPVLWRAPGSTVFESEKRFFTEHLEAVSEFDSPPKPCSTPRGPSH